MMNRLRSALPRARAARARCVRTFVACVAALLGATIALAADAQSAEPLPERVGRVANVQGALYHALDGGGGEWSPIGLNYPVAQGDSLWTEHDARAEVDYGGGQFRLAGDTNLHVSRLDERQLALFVASGRVIVRIRYLDRDDSVRVDTPSTQVALNRPGLYRIDVDPDVQRTTLIVREGEADIAIARGAEQVLPGQIAVVDGTGDVTADIRNGGGLDGFDTWSAARDRVYEASRENAYVSREMVGQYDLDAYGQWQTYPEYGAVWFPTVDPEWAPYRFGHWTWLPGYGYTWVDNAPWGYAPFHYGRWTYVGGRWGWCPGAFVARPVWAPALVAWYGGAGWGYGGSVDAPVYGWVPLGWSEPYVPWWRRCESRCYARYNQPYAVNVAERRDARPTHFANWSVPGGVTAVPAGTLTAGRPVAITRVPIDMQRASAPPPLAAPPAIKPAPVRPGAVRPGRGIPVPAATVAARAVAPASADVRSGTPTARSALAPVAPARIGEAAPASPVRPVVPVAPAEVQRGLPMPAQTPAPAPALRGAPSLPLSPVTPEHSARPSPALPPAPSLRPVPVAPAAPAPPPPRLPTPSLPLPRMPAPPVPGVSPAPPAAVVPVPRATPAPPHVVPAPAPAPAVVPAPAPAAAVAPASLRAPGSQN